MAATTYTDQQQYAKFQKKGCGEHGHSEECGCKGESKSDCGCCPPGLVAVYDSSGQHVACLTPNDAELYNKNTLVCKDGYVKLVRNSTGEVLGCVSEDVFEALNTSVNPPA
jgi:hypothetical protein